MDSALIGAQPLHSLSLVNVAQAAATEFGAFTPSLKGHHMNKTFIAASLLTLFSASVFAQAPATPNTPNTNTPRVDKREVRQEARIQQGVASGELNAKETARMEKGQDRVESAEAKAKADGNVTKKERAHLTHMQNKQSKRIARQKHDAQKAPAAVPAPAAQPK
jgi:hypothetical protein